MRDSRNGRRVSNILIFRIGQLGDTVVALPALWAVREQFPNARITFLGSQVGHHTWVSPSAILPAELVDEWMTYPSNENGTAVRTGLRLSASLRTRSFDLLVYLPQRTRTQWQRWRDLMGFRSAGIRRIIGGIRAPRSAQRSIHQPIQHEADYLLESLRKSGLKAPSEGQGRMDLSLTLAEHQRANEWIGAVGGPLIAFAPGSKWPSKVWAESRYAEVGHHLIQHFDAEPVVFGGAEDAAAGFRLVDRWKRGRVSAGELDIRTGAALLSRCALYVGNDTGTMHLASAVGVPCVVPFSAQDRPGRWSPYGRHHHVIRIDVPCAACQLKICNRRMECLSGITVQDVVQRCRVVLQENGLTECRAQ